MNTLRGALAVAGMQALFAPGADGASALAHSVGDRMPRAICFDVWRAAPTVAPTYDWREKGAHLTTRTDSSSSMIEMRGVGCQVGLSAATSESFQFAPPS
jgi:hypothetical protein